MATEVTISRADHWFAGTNTTIVFPPIYDSDGVTPKDVTGYAFAWVLRKRDADPDPAILEKTSAAGIAITGTYSADPDANTQRVEVTIADTDTEDLDAGTYRHSLKRTDEGSETILAFGNAVLQRATAR